MIHMATFISIRMFVSPLKMEKLFFLLHSIQKSTEVHHILCELFNCVNKCIVIFENLRKSFLVKILINLLHFDTNISLKD